MRSALLSWISHLVLLTTVVHGSPQLIVPTPPSASPASPISNCSSSTSSTFSHTTPAPGPKLTPPPSLDDVTAALQEKWHITTYYTCLTLAGHVDCGTHEPILPGGTEIAAAPPRSANARMAGMVAGAVVVVGFLL